MTTTGKAKGGKARQRQLHRQRRLSAPQFLNLANALSHPRPRRAPGRAGRFVEFLAKDLVGVERFLATSGISHRLQEGNPLVLVPIAYAAITLGRMMDSASAKRRVAVAFAGEEFLRAGLPVGLKTWTNDRSATEAWAFNLGVATELINFFLHAPESWLELIRRCGNPRCRHPYFLQRSIRKARFCPGRCRQDNHERRRASDE